MNLDDFSYVENDRRYVKPEISLNEQNAFIDNLRNTQAQDTAEIKQNTYNLGTAVPSNLGGLGGGSSYFASRYQTPQTNSMVADLRAAAQSKALSDVMQNEIAKAKKLYNDAYRAAKKRENNGGNSGNDYLDAISVLEKNSTGAGDKLSLDDVDEEAPWDNSSLANLSRKLDIARNKVANQKSQWGDDLMGGLSWFEKASGAGLPVKIHRTNEMAKNVAEVEELERQLAEAMKNGK